MTNTRTDAVLEHMLKNNILLTRENYLELAYFGNPPEPLSAEEEMELPEQFRIRPPDRFDE